MRNLWGIKYSLSEILKLAMYVVYTKLVLPNARLIRFPIDIRGKRYIRFGDGFTAGCHCRIETHPRDSHVVLRMGRNIQINDFVHIAARESVDIGDNALIASRVFISDITHGSYKGNALDSPPESVPKTRDLTASPVVIGKNVWIGEGVAVLPGVTIGEGAVIGANAVVTKDVPAYCVAVGNPARVIKRFNFDTRRWG